MSSIGRYNSITDVNGIKVGHFSDNDSLTGVTVILTPEGSVGGVDVRGGSPGTRETDLLSPVNRIQRIDAVCLCGSSAFGLNSVGGVMKYLEEKRIGHPVRDGMVVPIVSAAVIFDLGRGKSNIHVGESSGYQGCENAGTGSTLQGNYGAGLGALSGGYKGGVGTASEILDDGVTVGAITIVNSSGLAFDTESGGFYAGGLERNGEFGDLKENLKALYVPRPKPKWRQAQHTTIGMVATNLALNKPQVTKIAQMAHDGLARAIYPAHTMFDGDTIFAISTGEKSVEGLENNERDRLITQVGVSAADSFARAIVHGLISAESVGNYICHRDAFPGAYKILGS